MAPIGNTAFNLDSLNCKVVESGHDTIPIHFNKEQVYIIVAGRGKNFGVGAFTYLNGLTYAVGRHDKLTIVGFSDMSVDEYSDLSDLSHVLPVYWFLPNQNEAVTYCITTKEAKPKTDFRLFIVDKGKVVYTTSEHNKEAFKVVADTLWNLLARYPNKGGYRKV